MIDAIRPPSRTQAALRFRSLFLQASIGEHAFWPVDVDGVGLAFEIAHPVQLARSAQSTELFGVRTRRDASPSSRVGWAEYPRARLRRHWVPSPRWPDEARSSLERVRPEIGLYRDAVRAMQRTAQSRLLMNGLLWVSTNEEAGGAGDPWIGDGNAVDDPADGAPAVDQGGGLDRLMREYSQFGARAFRDTAGNDVAAQLPFPFPHHTAPEHIDIGRGMKREDLEVLTEIVFAGARALDIPTQYLVNGEASANAWNDAELRRALHERGVFPELGPNNDFWTGFAYRPLLGLTAAGGRVLGDDDPDDYRLGCDTSVLELRSDSLQAVALALNAGVASRRWAASKLGVTEAEMLDIPADITDYEHWIYARSSTARAGAEVQSDFPDLSAGLGLPAGDPAGGSTEPVADLTPRDPEPGVAAGALALIEGVR